MSGRWQTRKGQILLPPKETQQMTKNFRNLHPRWGQSQPHWSWLWNCDTFSSLIRFPPVFPSLCCSKCLGVKWKLSQFFPCDSFFLVSVYSSHRRLHFWYFWSPNMWTPTSPTSSSRSLGTNWVSYNLTQFWLHLPGDNSIRWNWKRPLKR